MFLAFSTPLNQSQNITNNINNGTMKISIFGTDINEYRSAPITKIKNKLAPLISV